ncbi:hypothetical protein EUU23_00210 [Sphingorhabdus sp. IMCC26285]|jgi:general secretion pathway protein M|uniref:Type II secretion system protein M n=1 Tax=Sphingorhabdus profundilacus TaxID=2509718 RepID=A0A6I4LV83_9SPHN|nr:type II secretion system protein GspM [Sphingorhabdus profundilacus]MVZ96123.1 hypothetical protein [Sphingorhabdus profundilacus]
MMSALQNWFEELSVRERWMVGVAALLAILAVLIFAIILPGMAAIDRAQSALDEAVQRRGRIEATVASALAQRPSGAPSNAANIDMIVTQGAAEKGFDLIQSTNAAPGQMAFRMDQARAPALLAWFNDLEMQGILVNKLTLRGNANGGVTVEAELQQVAR